MLRTHSWLGVTGGNLFDNFFNKNYKLWKNVKLQSLRYSNQILLGTYLNIDDELVLLQGSLQNIFGCCCGCFFPGLLVVLEKQY